MLLLARRQAARDALPQVPPLRAALDRARVAEIAAEHAPEAPDAHLVAGVAEAGAEKKAGEVEPARLVLRRAGAGRIERPRDVPERADRGERPCIASGVEYGLEATGERHGIVVALERCPEEPRRLLDARRIHDERRIPHGRPCTGADRVPEAELQAPAVVRRPRPTPNLERADLGQPHLEMDRERGLPELPAEAEDRPERRQHAELARRRGEDVTCALADAVR